MLINKDSVKWAIDFLHKHSDGDLFPRILELAALSEKADLLATMLCDADLSQLEIGGHRRFIIPKDEISYRQATQLDIQDSIILSSIIYQYGSQIEDSRLPIDTVFSYRFSPNDDYGLYAERNMWNTFWQTAYMKSRPNKTVLYCDIADFYNQLYHHTIENQLIESGFPNQVTKWVIKLLESMTVGVSRGIPVGPHPMHLIAEASMVPIDNSLKVQGYNFIRFADDIIVFCENEVEAKLVLMQIATTLDKQQRLMLQRHKTKIYSTSEFESKCENMIEDRPISEQEDQVLKLINKYSGGNPYRTVYYNDISEEDWNSISSEIISNIITDYLSQPIIQFDKLRWFYRRLTQIGHPGAIEISLHNMDKLIPCFANVCMYLGSVQNIPVSKWSHIGEQLLVLLQNEMVRGNEYFRLLILNLFTRNQYINHFPSLVRDYPIMEPFVKREIILSAKQNKAIDWLREQKENYSSMESWQQMAYIFSIADLPRDERKFFLNRFMYPRSVMRVLSKWAKEQ